MNVTAAAMALVEVPFYFNLTFINPNGQVLPFLIDFGDNTNQAINFSNLNASVSKIYSLSSTYVVLLKNLNSNQTKNVSVLGTFTSKILLFKRDFLNSIKFYPVSLKDTLVVSILYRFRYSIVSDPLF